MRKTTILSRGLFLLACLVSMTGLTSAQTTGQWGQWCYKDYSYTGSEQTFRVPDNCTKVTVEAIGGGGAGGYAYKGFLAVSIINWSHDYYRVGGGGGGAAYVRTENRSVATGDVLTINIGQGGQNSGDGAPTTVYFGSTKWLEAAGGKHGEWSRSGQATGNLHAEGGNGGAGSDSYYIGTGIAKSGGKGGKAKDYDTGLSPNAVGSGSGGGAAGGNSDGGIGSAQSGGNSNAIGAAGGDGGGGAANDLISGGTWLKGGKGAQALYGKSGWSDGGDGAAPGAGGSGARADENHGPFNGGNGGNGMVRVWFYIENASPLTVSVGTTSTGCPYTLDASVSNELFTRNYLWSTGASTASITVNPSVDSRYAVSVTDVYSDATNSCQITSSNFIDIDACSDCSVSINTATAAHETVCRGESTTLSVVLASTDAGTTYTYVWSADGVLVGSTDVVSVTPTATTTYTISVTATKGSCSVSDSRTVNVTVNEKVTPTFASLKDHYCEGETLTLTTISDNSVTGTWNTPSPTTFSDYKTYDYIFTPTSGQCANIFSKTVTVYNEPAAGEIHPNIVICNGETAKSFENSTSASGGYNGKYTWQVSLDQVDWITIPSANSENYAPMTDIATVTAGLGIAMTGTFYFRRAWDNNCEVVYSNVLSLDNPGTLNPGNLTVTGDPAGSYCADKAVNATLTANPTAEVASPAFSYQWQKSTDGVTWTDTAGATESTFTVSLNPVKKISFRYRVKYASCDWMTSNNTYDLTVNDLPTVQINGANPATVEMCAGGSVTLTATGASTYKWSGSGSTANPASISTPGEYTVTGTDENGCVNTAAVTVSNYTAPAYTFSAPSEETFSLPYGSTEMNVTLSGTPVFTPSDAGFTVENNLTNPLAEGTHNVTWTLKDACGNVLDTDNQTVIVNPFKCPDNVTFDGYAYPVVRVNTQCWFKENLKATTGIDGAVAYKGNIINQEKFGLLYTWQSAVINPNEAPETGSEEGTGSGPATMMPMPIPAAVTDAYTQGICPKGWGIPTREDFQILFSNAGNDIAHLKDMDSSVWLAGKGGTTPSTGFDARGAGYYNSALTRYEDLLSITRFWTETSNGNGKATCCEFNYYCNEPMFKEIPTLDKVSVRCLLKNADEIATP